MLSNTNAEQMVLEYGCVSSFGTKKYNEIIDSCCVMNQPNRYKEKYSDTIHNSSSSISK